jgi:heme exporter protein B
MTQSAAIAVPKRRKMSAWRQFKAILRKDIVMELRTKEMLTSMGLYALLVLVVYFITLQSAGQNFPVE